MRDVDDPASLVKSMNRAECEAYKRQGIIADGMIPKLDNSFKAIEDGVLEVVILHAKICFQKKGTILLG